MKRDLDLVRSILIETEKADDELNGDDFVNDAWEQNVVIYHVGLLISQGLIDGRVICDLNGDPMDARVCGLTWDGQDFLDAIRDKRVWAKAKKAIAGAVGSTTFGVVKEVCSSLALSLVKTRLGI